MTMDQDRIVAGDFHPQHIDFKVSAEHQQRWLTRRVVWPAQNGVEGYIQYKDGKPELENGQPKVTEGKFFRLTNMVGSPFLFIPGERADGPVYRETEEWLPTMALTQPAPAGLPMMFGAFNIFRDDLNTRPAYFEKDYGVPWGYWQG
jgi:hypothetical protein